MLREKENFNKFYIVPLGFIGKFFKKNYSFPLKCEFDNYYNSLISSTSKVKKKKIILELRDLNQNMIIIHQCLCKDENDKKFIFTNDIRLTNSTVVKGKKRYNKELRGYLVSIKTEELLNNSTLRRIIWDRYQIKLDFNDH